MLLLLASISTLIIFVWIELRVRFEKRRNSTSVDSLPSRALSPAFVPLLLPPVHNGSAMCNLYHPDIITLTKIVPRNVKRHSLLSAEKIITFDANAVSLKETVHDNKTEDVTMKIAKTLNTLPVNNASESNIAKIVLKIMNPLPPGCEPTSAQADELHQKYPSLSMVDIVRYLVARKGNVKLAEEMIVKSMEWRQNNFPLKRSDVEPALRTNCLFPHGTAKDGTPVIYFRGGLYDNTKATAEQFVMAASYAIDYVLQQHPLEVNITIVVHTGHVDNAPNAGADTNFLKLFIQTLSDNYPERLRRFAMFPFPWYGRAIWSVMKVFIDKRTQEKVMLLSDADANGIPMALQNFLDPKAVPVCIGGKNTEPILNLLDTF